MTRVATGILTAIWLIFWASVAQATTYPGLDQIVRSTAELVRSQFIDESRAASTADEILKRYAAGEYSHLETPEDVERELTRELRAISGDTHIGLVFDRASVARYRARENRPTSPVARRADEIARATSAEEARLDNYGIRAVEILPGGVGYLRLDGFDSHVDEAQPAIASAMNLLAGSDVVIVDLRRNGGGSSRALPLILGYFLGPDAVHFATRRERWTGLVEPLYTTPPANGARHYDKPLIILTSGTTYSLAEHFTYHLKSLRPTIIVGERTYGGGNGWDPVVLNDDFYLRLPRVGFSNARTGTIFVEGEGITPDIPVPSATAMGRGYVEALNVLLSQDAGSESRPEVEWALRVASARMTPQSGDEPGSERLAGQFGEYLFEPRPDGLYLSFRGLPFYKLERLSSGLYLDDRSIQQQLRFIAAGSSPATSLEVLRYGESSRTISRTEE